MLDHNSGMLDLLLGQARYDHIEFIGLGKTERFQSVSKSLLFKREKPVERDLSYSHKDQPGVHQLLPLRVKNIACKICSKKHLTTLIKQPK